MDVFFVISGYLITSLIEEDRQLGRFSIAEFYERRDEYRKVLNRPEVQRFFKKCVGKLADNANEMIQRVYLRSVQAHAAADEAFQRMQEADKMVEDSRKHSVTDGKESSSSKESRRS